MDAVDVGQNAIGNLVYHIEEIVDEANLLALDLALENLEKEMADDGMNLEIDGVQCVVKRCVQTTDELELLLNQGSGYFQQCGQRQQ